MDRITKLGSVLDSWGKRIGALLLILREQERQLARSHLSQEAKRKGIGIDPKTIKSIERGAAGVTAAKIEDYAAALGVTLHELSAVASSLEAMQNRLTVSADPLQREEGQVQPPKAAVGRRPRPKKPA